MPGPPWRRLTGRRFVRFSAAAAAFVAGLALSMALLLPEPDDPTRAPPRHTLTVDEARVHDERGGQRLVVRGTTSLPDGCLLSVVLLAGEREALRLSTTAADGRYAVDARAEGDVVEGRYSAQASFALEEQPQAVREALRYEPRRLEASLPVALPPRLTRAAEVKDELKSLLLALSQSPLDPGVQADVDRRAEALGARLWLTEQRGALRSLRVAVAEARRPVFERRAFDRLLLEAHVLAGL